MTEKEARRLCLLQMADSLAEEAIGRPVGAVAGWASTDSRGELLTEEGRRNLRKAVVKLVTEWRDQAAALGE